MSSNFDTPMHYLKLLAHDLRWQMMCLLAREDLRVNELVSHVGEPMNLVSYHLRKLRQAELVISRRSDADGRDVYYSMNLERARELFYMTGYTLHPGLLGDIDEVPKPTKPTRLLFLCTHNSARSQIAEGLARSIGGANVEVYSAGNHPTTVRPDAVRVMDEIGIDIRRQQTNHVKDYVNEAFDYVITVCDNAREVCPTFDHAEHHLHWGFPDPASVEDEQARITAYRQVTRRLKSRLTYFFQSLQSEANPTI
jgi:protein-tyrosine-phosphatase/DNA-binding transcriptional ArsR family regulator